jgi:acyl carrier protein
MDAGLNSMMAVQLRTILSNEMSVNLPTTLLFDYPTISALTDYIGSSIAQEAGASPRTPPHENEAAL